MPNRDLDIQDILIRSRMFKKEMITEHELINAIESLLQQTSCNTMGGSQSPAPNKYIQPKEIEEYFNDKDRRLDDEFGWTGEYRLSAKDVLDFTIDKGACISLTKKVCYCGSLRVAIDAFKKAEYEAVMKGEIALLPCCMFVDIQREYGAESDYKQKADDLHKRKIDISDEVFVLNVGGYIGDSTRNEIDYALKIGKPVKYLEPITP